MSTVDAAGVLTPDGWTGPTRVHHSGGVIRVLEPLDRVDTSRRIVPGFVDLQVNGIDDVDVSRAQGADWDRLDQLLLAQGVTTWCPTLVTMPLERYTRPLTRVAEAMARPAAGRPTIAGAHLEGPFLGRAPGAHPVELIVPIDLNWLESLPDQVAVVTLAAEQPLAVAAVELLVRAGRLVSIGHTRCTEAEFDAAVAAGARLTTHLFNGMSGVHHREPGVAAFALTNDDVCASLIADGVHVHPRVLRLAAQALGAERTVLVTDSVAWRAGNVGGIGLQWSDGAPRLPDGTLAGSGITMDRAIWTATMAGVPFELALAAASRNPARLLGLHDRGAIEPGKRADMVAVIGPMQIEQVWVGGVPV